jgi:carboxypeptidase Taq
MTHIPPFEELHTRRLDVGNLHAAAAELEWDQEVYVPSAGGPARGRQLATLNAQAHALFAAPEVADLLGHTREQAGLTPDQAAMLEEIAYDYARASRIPGSLIRRFSKARSAAYQAWLEARGRSDFALFLPHLKALIELCREKAECLGYEDTPYDALLEDYERGMTTARLKPVFELLARRQSDLVARIGRVSGKEAAPWLRQRWDTARQWEFTERVLRDMGFDFKAGRQDRSAHPFTTNFSIHDVRITTRLSEDDFFSALFSSVHEGGHALYEQGFREEDEGTLLASAPSLGIHESQSRLWENVIGRSLPFWRHYLPALRALYPGQLDRVDAEDLFKAANRVSPSLIRVEADECTYNLHIILRFELEVALIEGKLEAEDVPSAWNEKIKHYLGLEVPNDAMGCLQDIHWSHGSFGYFPTYALGNLYAAQLLATMQRDIPGLWEEIGRGAFGACLDWLREKVHRIGRRKTAVEIIREATGADTGPDAFLDYLESKYASLYNLHF